MLRIVIAAAVLAGFVVVAAVAAFGYLRLGPAGGVLDLFADGRRVPELIGSGYGGVAIRDVLTMSSGVALDEDDTHLRSDVMQLPLRLFVAARSRNSSGWSPPCRPRTSTGWRRWRAGSPVTT